MRRGALAFDRPAGLEAIAPPERRGLARDAVRLLVSTPAGHRHARFWALDRFLAPGDLLVVNESATLPASLPAHGRLGDFLLNLSTDFGHGLWLAEPRWSIDRPGPLPLVAGEELCAAGLRVRLVAPCPGQERLWFVHLDGALQPALDCCGRPIRYGYLAAEVPLAAYQTLFARVPGSAEMPSAARPFTPRVVARLERRGVALARLVLHTGVSSLEVGAEGLVDGSLYAEPFDVPAATAEAINATRAAGGRVIAVGTTVVRALESAWQDGAVRAARGFTRLVVRPGRAVQAVDGLLTGLHDSGTSHLAMLYALAGEDLVRSAYAEAVRAGYLWHEFGDSHLILPARGGRP
jgi:S-adenosylmethionine:tRNA ribosyltransferase-isomerase